MSEFDSKIMEDEYEESCKKGNEEAQEERNRLYAALEQEGRLDDLLLCIKDEKYYIQLLKEYKQRDYDTMKKVGREIARKEIVSNMLSKRYTCEQIAEITDIPIDIVYKIEKNYLLPLFLACEALIGRMESGEI